MKRRRMLEDLRSGDHLGLDVVEASGELRLILDIGDPAKKLRIHPTRAIDRGQNGSKPCHVWLVHENHAGPFQSLKQGFHMMTHAESEYEHTGSFSRIHSLGPASGSC